MEGAAEADELVAEAGLSVFSVRSVFFSVVPVFSALSGFSVFSLLSSFAAPLSPEALSVDPPES